MDGERDDVVAPVWDFLCPTLSYRIRASQREPLVRAVGLKQGYPLHVVDATAGLGRDAFVLAAAGATVTMIERSEDAAEALSAAMERARAAGDPWSPIVARMSLLHGDSKHLLPILRPGVASVDPMHPPRQKSALVKKDIRFLRSVVGEDGDAEELLRCAMATVTDRVVLKWPVRARLPAFLPKPTFQTAGKAVRFLVFIRRSLPSAGAGT